MSNPLSISPVKDIQWMQKAIMQAKLAAQAGEVPVGAVIVRDNYLLAEAGNSPVRDNDPTAHAEINVLRLACNIEKNYRLPGTTIYTTLEPCVMCMGAIIHARVDRLVFSAADPKTGAAGSLYNLGRDSQLNHKLKVKAGLLEDESTKLLKDFFREKRLRTKKNHVVF